MYIKKYCYDIKFSFELSKLIIYDNNINIFIQFNGKTWVFRHGALDSLLALVINILMIVYEGYTPCCHPCV